nr:MAG TPA: hypothetical protein [Caudoviricetes sp.]
MLIFLLKIFWLYIRKRHPFFLSHIYKYVRAGIWVSYFYCIISQLTTKRIIS